MKVEKILKYIFCILLLIALYLIALDLRYQTNTVDNKFGSYVSVFDSWIGDFKNMSE